MFSLFISAERPHAHAHMRSVYVVDIFFRVNLTQFPGPAVTSARVSGKYRLTGDDDGTEKPHTNYVLPRPTLGMGICVIFVRTFIIDSDSSVASILSA